MNNIPKSKTNNVVRKGWIRVPRDVSLTPRVLLGAATKMTTPLVEMFVEELIDELDARVIDCDLEPDDCDFEDEFEI